MIMINNIAYIAMYYLYNSNSLRWATYTGVSDRKLAINNRDKSDKSLGKTLLLLATHTHI